MAMSLSTTLAFFNLESFDLIVVAIIGILIFGRRLPEIGRNLGKTIVEFKKGLSSTQDEIHQGIAEDDKNAYRELPPANARQIKRATSAGGDEP